MVAVLCFRRPLCFADIHAAALAFGTVDANGDILFRPARRSGSAEFLVLPDLRTRTFLVSTFVIPATVTVGALAACRLPVNIVPRHLAS